MKKRKILLLCSLIICLSLLCGLLPYTMANVNIDTGSIEVTFTSGSKTGAFDNKTVILNANSINGYVTFPENFSSIAVMNENSYLSKVDDETFYFDGDDGFSYTFTGWKIAGSDKYLPMVTVFQPNDIVDIKTLNVNGNYKLTLEAVWGRVIYLENEYDGRYYTDYWIYDKATTEDGRYNRSNSWNYKYEDNVLTLNKGKDYNNPLSSLDYAYYVLNKESEENYNRNPYLNVITLTGNYDYVRGSSVSSGQANYFTSYASYNKTFVDNGDTYSVVDDSYNVGNHYIWGEYTAQTGRWGYASSSSNWFAVTFKSIGNNKYNIYWNGMGYSDQMYGSIRFDNIKLGSPPNNSTKRPMVSSPSGMSSETSFSGGKGDCIEFTNRMESINNSYVLRPGAIQIVVVNGGKFPGWQTSWSSNINADYNISWFLGSSGYISADVTLGTTAGYSNTNTYINLDEFSFTMTGGTVTGSIYGSSNYSNEASHGNRIINIIGDRGSSSLSNPIVNGNIYGGGGKSSLVGDTYINIYGCTKLGVNNNVYGGGHFYNATLYGNSNVTISNSIINGNVFGGGYNGNIDEDESGHGGNINLNIKNSQVLGNVYGVGRGGTQSSVSSVSVGAGNSTYNWQTVPFSPTSSFFNSIKNPDYGDYDTDWSWDKPATGFPFMVTNPDSREYGYVCASITRNVSWTSNSSTSLSFGRTRDFYYLSLAYARGDVGIVIYDSVIGVPENDSKGNVYGGGSIAIVYGNVDIDIHDTTVNGNIYGGGDGTSVPANVTLYMPHDEDTYVPPSYTYNPESGTVSTRNNSDSSSLRPYGSFTWSNDISLLDVGGIDYDRNLIYSPNTEGLGSVSGNIKLHINNVTVNGTVYGGGNKGIVRGDSIIILENSTITDSLYTGGNSGDIEGNTSLTVNNSHVEGNVYGGCNSANVLGNSFVRLSNNSQVDGSVFGGGNSGNVGVELLNNSTCEVRIIGATIGKNVYGGGNTSRVYGNTIVKIGKNTVDVLEYPPSDIKILGSVYGGGEANASGSANYDFSFISVTDGVLISIDGSGHDELYIKGAIFGSGNASTSSGESNVIIKNYGDSENILNNTSIQRASKVIIDNSYIELKGIVDSTNRWGNELFSISRVDELVLKNGSELYLNNGTNLLKKWSSLDSSDEPATYLADNRVYIYEGKSVKITTSEDNSSYGQVSGITLMGVYKKIDDDIKKGLYDFDNPQDDVVFSGGVYIIGGLSSNILENGFNSIYAVDSEIEVVKPSISGLAHVWQVGTTTKEVNINLKVNSYSAVGKFAVTELFTSEPNTSYTIDSIDLSGLASGVEFVRLNEVPRFFDDTDDSNKYLGLQVNFNTADGWNDDYVFDVVSDSSDYFVGNDNFLTSYSNITPSIQLLLSNALNFTRTDTFGVVTINLIGTYQVDELNWNNYKVKINITIDPEVNDTSDYEASIAPGEKYSPFGSVIPVINKNSSFTISYTLTWRSDIFSSYDSIERVLKSDYVLPANTKLTLIDNSDLSNPKQYYYIVSASDYLGGKKEYSLHDFKLMGYIDNSKNYDDSVSYYDSATHVYYEQLFVIVDFSSVTSNVYNVEHHLELEVRDNLDNVVGVISHDLINNIKYTIIDDEFTYSLDDSTILKDSFSKDEDINLDVSVILSSTSYVDTSLNEKSIGLKMSLYKKIDGIYTKISGSDMFSKMIKINNKIYYPNREGYYFVKFNNMVVDSHNTVSLVTSDSEIDKGDYRINIDMINSYTGETDGVVLATKTLDFSIIDESYGLNIDVLDKDRVINNITGKSLNGNNNINFNIKYQSNLSNPSIKFKIYKKRTSSYALIDAEGIISNELDLVGNRQYLLFSSSSLLRDMSFNVSFKENISVGSYKFCFELYDGDKKIGEKIVQLLVDDFGSV